MMEITHEDRLFTARLFGFASWEQFEQGSDIQSWDAANAKLHDVAAFRIAAEQAVLAKLREPSFDMVRKLNAACDVPDVSLAWVFPYIATLLQEQKP